MAIALADLFSSITDPFSDGASNYAEKNVDSINSAQEAYGLSGFTKDGGIQQLNLPKLQFGFIIQFVMSDAASEFLEKLYPGSTAREMSYLVKDCDLPSQTFDVQTVNQYNRTRVYPGRVTYNPINLAVYDTVDSGALKIYDAYRAWYNADFYNKRIYHWEYNQVSTSGNFEPNDDKSALYSDEQDYFGTDLWGRSTMNQGDLDEGYFFKRLDIIEIQDGVYTYHNIFNPVISSSTFETKSHESDGAPALINFTLNYEGIAHINPIPGNYYPDRALCRQVTELSSALSIANLNGDRHFASGLTQESENVAASTSIGSITDTALSFVSGVTEAFGIPGVDSAVTNVGNAVSAGTDLVGDTAQGVTNTSALNSIGGI